MIDRLTIDKIYAAANIVDVIGDFITLKKKGINYQACCPFHNEKTPSFVVSPAKGVYKCFGCSKGGNAVSFVMEHEQISYTDALKYVARKYGIEVVEEQFSAERIKENDDRESMMVVSSFAADYFKKQLTESSEGRNVGLSYFQERGFTEAIINKFNLGYCPSSGDGFSQDAISAGYKEDFIVRTGLTIKRDNGGYYDRFSGRVIFPIYSLSGRVIAFGGRTLRSDKKTAKYLNSPESEIYHKSNTLYGIWLAKKAITSQNRCILVEGYTDVISMHQSGIENVVASSGTSLTTEQIRLISRFTNNVTVIYDGDSAGIKASIRGIDMILKEGLNVRVVLLPESEDPDSFAKSHSAHELNDYILNNEEDFISFKTKLLIGEVKDDPIGRGTVISDIISSIAVIPNNIMRAQYIRECSRLMDVDAELVSKEVVRKRIDILDGSAGREVLRNMERKEQFEKRNEPKPEYVPETFDGGLLFGLEKELISYLLKYGDKSFYFPIPGAEIVELNIAQTLIDELSVDNIEMKDPINKEILDSYIAIREEFVERNEEPIVSINIFVNHCNPKICNFVVDILTKDEQYRPSKIWSKYEEAVITEDKNLDVAIPKTIALYKLKVIDDMVDSLRESLPVLDKEEDGMKVLDIFKKISDLTASRKLICEKYSRIM